MDSDNQTRSSPNEPQPENDISGLDGLTEHLGLEPASPDHDPLRGQIIGGVTLVRPIGKGGMGIVYEGRQDRPNRIVAVKVMAPGLTSPSLLKRFQYEAEVLGRLQHPGIAHIYSVGVHRLKGASVPYFVMEYIANAKTLIEYADELKMAPRQRLDLFKSVCEAVAHGHQKGVIHRDLKPSNILVDHTGQPKVIDFGVARATDSDMAITTMQTDVGQLVGTLQYMSPEQVNADPNDIDVRSDVYALGVVLYELLAGKPPYDVRKKAIHEVIRIVQEEAPTPLSALNRALRGDVAVIAGKCLEKDRGHRYSSASELGADIGRYLAGDAIIAMPPGFVDGLLRLARKHRVAAVAVAGLLSAIVVAAASISVFAVRAEIARRIAVDQQQRATLASERAKQARGAAEDLAVFMMDTLTEKLRKIGRLDLMGEVLGKLSGYHQQRIHLEQTAGHAPTEEDMQRRQTFYGRLGDLATATGDFKTARTHYEEALKILLPLTQTGSDSVNIKADLARRYRDLGRLADLAHNKAGAFANHLKASEIFEDLHAHHPEHGEWLKESALSHEYVGNVLLGRGEFAAARHHIITAAEIYEEMAAADPSDAGLRNRVNSSLLTVGTLELREGNFTEGAEKLARYCSAMEPIASRDPDNTDVQTAYAAGLFRCGEALCGKGDPDVGRERCLEAIGIYESLVEKEPKNFQWQVSLIHQYGGLGLLAKNRGKWAEARDWFSKEVRGADRLFAGSNDPGATSFRVMALWLLAECHRKLGEEDAAKECESKMKSLKQGAKSKKADTEHGIPQLPFGHPPDNASADVPSGSDDRGSKVK